MQRPGNQARGFTYIGVLIMVAVIGVAAAATVQVGAIAGRRAAEEELLAVGLEFRRALGSYARVSPAGQRQSPTELRDLLRDQRFSPPLRHLRKLYADPITGQTAWGIVRTTDGGIAGIHSLSDAAPIKVANFDTDFDRFENKTSYRQWVFTAAAQ